MGLRGIENKYGKGNILGKEFFLIVVHKLIQDQVKEWRPNSENVIRGAENWYKGYKLYRTNYLPSDNLGLEKM